MPYTEPLDVQINNIEIDNTLAQNQKINAREYLFPFEVKDIEVDTSEMKALILVRKPKDKVGKTPGTIIYYDLINNEVLWIKRSYAWEPVFLKDRIIIKGGKNALSTSIVFALSKETGNMIWERPGGYYFYNEKNKIAFTGLLRAFNMESGANLWSREISNKFGWLERTIQDSILFAAVDGLHTFNLKDGHGWDINMSTGKTNEAGVGAANVGLAVLGAFTGVYTSVQVSYWRGMASNVLYDDDKMFFSAKENLICVNKDTGKEYWRTSLPDKKTAKTTLINDGENLFLVNEGACYKNHVYIKYGFPYLAKYDKLTGEQIFFSLLNTDYPVKDVEVTENGYYIITNSAFYYYDFEGSLKTKLEFDENDALKYGDFVSLTYNSEVFENSYFKNNNNFELLTDYFNNSYVPKLMTENGLIVFNENFEIDSWFLSEEIYYTELEHQDNKFLKSFAYAKIKPQYDQLYRLLNVYKNSKMKRLYSDTKIKYDNLLSENFDLLQDCYLIDSQNNYKGTVNIGERISKIKDNLYFTRDNSLIIISDNSIK